MAEQKNVPEKKSDAIAQPRGDRDPFTLIRQMTSELERMFEGFPAFRWPEFAGGTVPNNANWSPKIDVIEKNGRLVTRVDLPGTKKEDVSVEVSDGQLVLSGERKRESEEKKKDFYRSEREYGSFYRSVPLPDGVKLEDIKANFADGVLEVSVPMPANTKAASRKIPIGESKTAKTAAA
jgi:HSP20 family protein